MSTILHPRHTSDPIGSNHAPFPGLRLSNINLKVKDGTKNRKILDDVNLHVRPGELVGVTGPSGSGKSTLLAVAGCLQEPTSGHATLILETANNNAPVELVLDGISAREAARVRREHIGIVFQQPNLLPSLTVGDQLMAKMHLGSVWPLTRAAKRAAEARMAELLQAVDLPGYENRKVAELSGGQQARVNLARAFMNSPQLLLVDEPTAALDTVTAEKITELVRHMASDNNAATLYVSHDSRQLDTLDRTITLVDGKILADN